MLWAGRHPISTCCHDDSCEDFPSCMGGGEVVCQLTELIHHQARDGISQNLELHTHTCTRTHTHTHTHTHTCAPPHKDELVSDMSAYKARLMLSSPGAPCTCHSARIQLQTRARALKRQQVKLGWPPEVYLTVFQATLFEFGVTVLIYLSLLTVNHKKQKPNK